MIVKTLLCIQAKRVKKEKTGFSWGGWFFSLSIICNTLFQLTIDHDAKSWAQVQQPCQKSLGESNKNPCG